jgi:hypothetical protein
MSNFVIALLLDHFQYTFLLPKYIILFINNEDLLAKLEIASSKCLQLDKVLPTVIKI